MKSIPIWKLGGMLVCILGTFLVACGPVDTAATYSNPPACTPTATEANVYRSNIDSEVDLLYSRAFADQSINNLQIIQNEAFTLLMDRVKRWSSSNDIPVGDQNVIRITLTYVSPELAQIIILNQQLHQPIESVDVLRQKLLDKMNTVAVRNELMFLATITYSQYDQNHAEENIVSINFPIKNVTLINAGDRHIFVNHFDPPLEHEIVVSRGPISGYIAFPIGVMDGEKCLHIMDRKWNTMLTVNATGIKVKGESYGHPLTWFIKYHPLIEMNDSTVSPPVIFPAPADIKTDYQPPSPARNVPASQANEEYWKQMAIHVWAYMVGP